MSTYGYILVLAAVIYAVRALPMTLLRKPIRNRFLRSFLYYVPYVTLAVMTFPAIIQPLDHPLPGLLALAVGVVSAWLNGGLLITAAAVSATALIASLIL